ncbi:hypothetical protein PRUPE_1G120800 [Prunus persica]|uniref:Uncharacterized protein n=1 Tax=Prunus persica TaxID=3760 RepID=A0A251QWD1_PRUPE|nr:hypothetical protein PRUPE_1G120800 [Prunus persica]
MMRREKNWIRQMDYYHDTNPLKNYGTERFRPENQPLLSNMECIQKKAPGPISNRIFILDRKGGLPLYIFLVIKQELKY